MKHTKKRALLSAIAMLVVSAVVLSSATFAWFIAGDNANVESISANVATSSSIEVSADDVNYSATLLKSDLQTSPPAAADNSFPNKLTAISTPATVAMNFVTGELLNTKVFTPAPASAADIAGSLVKFTFWIKAGEDATVRFTTSTLTGGTALNAVYVAMQVGTTSANAAAQPPLKFAAAAGNYTSITSATTATDSNSNGIIDSLDVPAPSILGSVVSAVPFTSASDFTLSAGISKQIIIYMWLEGQDANCKLGANGVTGSAALALNFVKVINP